MTDTIRTYNHCSIYHDGDLCGILRPFFIEENEKRGLIFTFHKYIESQEIQFGKIKNTRRNIHRDYFVVSDKADQVLSMVDEVIDHITKPCNYGEFTTHEIYSSEWFMDGCIGFATNQTFAFPMLEVKCNSYLHATHPLQLYGEHFTEMYKKIRWDKVSQKQNVYKTCELRQEHNFSLHISKDILKAIQDTWKDYIRGEE